MNLQAIRYFLTLCAEKNFGRAAKRCRVSQPTLSNAIQKLEQTVGGLLFDRTRNGQEGSRPTALALALKPCFERMLTTLDQVHAVAREHKVRQRTGKLPSGST
jgi:DNA-binding transcriptional LysR family regulator